MELSLPRRSRPAPWNAARCDASSSPHPRLGKRRQTENVLAADGVGVEPQCAPEPSIFSRRTKDVASDKASIAAASSGQAERGCKSQSSCSLAKDSELPVNSLGEAKQVEEMLQQPLASPTQGSCSQTAHAGPLPLFHDRRVIVSEAFASADSPFKVIRSRFFASTPADSDRGHDEAPQLEPAPDDRATPQSGERERVVGPAPTTPRSGTERVSASTCGGASVSSCARATGGGDGVSPGMRDVSADASIKAKLSFRDRRRLCGAYMKGY